MKRLEGRVDTLAGQQRAIYRDPSVQSFKELRATVDDKEMKDMASGMIRTRMKDIGSGVNADISGAYLPMGTKRKRDVRMSYQKEMQEARKPDSFSRRLRGLRKNFGKS